MFVSCLLWLLIVVACDVRNRRVPNVLVLGGAGLAFIALACGYPLRDMAWPESLMGAGAGFALLLPFYAAGLMGAGDVKFAAALGLWTGPLPLVFCWLAGSVLAGLHAVAWLTRERWWTPVQSLLSHAGRPPSASPEVTSRGARIPLAAYMALAGGSWLVFGLPSA